MLTVLGQIGGAGAGGGAPPALPAPSMLVHYTVELPWILAGLLVAGAALAVWMFNQQAKIKLGLMVGAGLLVAAAGVVVAAGLVTTRREEVVARTRELISRTAAADISALEEMLAAGVKFRLFAEDRVYSREQMLDLVRQYPGGMYPIRSHSIDEMQAVIDGRNAARTQVRVMARSREATMYDVPVGSWWRIEWRLDGDGRWRVDGIECLSIDGVGGARP